MAARNGVKGGDNHTTLVKYVYLYSIGTNKGEYEYKYYELDGIR